MRKIQNIIEVIAKAVLQFLYKIAGKEMTKMQWESWRQFIGFVEVGITNFLVNYITYAFFLYIGFSYHMANVMGFIISVFNAFYWNNKFVFKQEESGKRSWLYTLIKTYISYAFTGLLLTEVLLYIEISILGLPQIIGPVINLFITTPFNFILNKFWTFKVNK